MYCCYVSYVNQIRILLELFTKSYKYLLKTLENYLFMFLTTLVSSISWTDCVNQKHSKNILN